MTVEAQAPETEDKPVAPKGDTPVDLGGTAEKAAPAADPVDKDEPVDDGVAVYEPTGDVALDMALEFIGKQGLMHDHPAMVAASAGNFDLLRATLAAKGAPGWEQYVALGEKAYKATTEANAAKAEKDKAAIYAAAGGEEQWKAVREWAAANASDEERAEINKQLSAGGIAAKTAAVYLANLYSRAANVNENGKAVAPDAGRVAGKDSTGALSPKAYASAVAELNVQLKGRIEGTKEYQALQRRRSAWRG